MFRTEDILLDLGVWSVGKYQPFDKDDGPLMAAALYYLPVPGKPVVRYCENDNTVYIDGMNLSSEAK